MPNAIIVTITSSTDYTVDYKETNLAAAIKRISPDGVDLIFDAASGETLQKSLETLKPKGKLVSILNQGNDLPETINFQYVFVEPNSNELAALAELAEKGHLEVPVSARFSLDQTAEAMRQIETHHTRGKIVIIP